MILVWGILLMPSQYLSIQYTPNWLYLQPYWGFNEPWKKPTCPFTLVSSLHKWMAPIRNRIYLNSILVLVLHSILKTDSERLSQKTGSIPRCPLQYHSLVCVENNLFIVGIGPILNKELEYFYLSDRSHRTYFYS